MKILLRLMVLLLVVSCKNDLESVTDYKSQEELDKRISEGKPFFDFDEVVHYEITILEKDLIKLSSNKDSLSQNVRFLRDLLNLPVPKTQEEKKTFYKAINSVPNNENIINPKFYTALRSKVFSEKKCNKREFAMCGPIYRDIFIFKKQNKEIGIAKICYECGLYSFSEGDFTTECFGMNNEFYELHKITTENKKLKK